MTTRLCGLAFGLLGAALAALPFTRWYRADVPGREITATGVAISGELWTVPVLASIIVAIGVVVVVRTPDPASLGARWLGGACAVLGVTCSAWALWSIVRITHVAVPVGIADGPTAPVSAQSTALVAAAAGACVAAVSLWWLRVGLDTGRDGKPGPTR